jgi:hypothetical protein
LSQTNLGQCCNFSASDKYVDVEQACNVFLLDLLCWTYVWTHWHHGDIFLSWWLCQANIGWWYNFCAGVGSRWH